MAITVLDEDQSFTVTVGRNEINGLCLGFPESGLEELRGLRAVFDKNSGFLIELLTNEFSGGNKFNPYRVRDVAIDSLVDGMRRYGEAFLAIDTTPLIEKNLAVLANAHEKRAERTGQPCPASCEVCHPPPEVVDAAADLDARRPRTASAEATVYRYQNAPRLDHRLGVIWLTFREPLAERALAALRTLVYRLPLYVDVSDDDGRMVAIKGGRDAREATLKILLRYAHWRVHAGWTKTDFSAEEAASEWLRLLRHLTGGRSAGQQVRRAGEEAEVTIDGNPLSMGAAITLRVAVSDFLTQLRNPTHAAALGPIAVDYRHHAAYLETLLTQRSAPEDAQTPKDLDGAAER